MVNKCHTKDYPICEIHYHLSNVAAGSCLLLCAAFADNMWFIFNLEKNLLLQRIVQNWSVMVCTYCWEKKGIYESTSSRTIYWLKQVHANEHRRGPAINPRFRKRTVTNGLVWLNHRNLTILLRYPLFLCTIPSHFLVYRRAVYCSWNFG